MFRHGWGKGRFWPQAGVRRRLRTIHRGAVPKHRFAFPGKRLREFGGCVRNLVRNPTGWIEVDENGLLFFGGKRGDSGWIPDYSGRCSDAECTICTTFRQNKEYV